MIGSIQATKEEISRIINKSGYLLETFKDNGRTYIGEAKKDGQLFFIKISKTKRENLFLQNSVAFNREILRLKPPFQVSEIADTGIIFDDFYYKIETKLKGSVFATLHKGITELNVENPGRYFLKISQMIEWLQKQQIVIPKGFDQQLHAFFKKDNQSAINTMVAWSFNATPRFSDLLKIVQANQSALEPILAHQDMTEINTMIVDEENVGLIDTDLAETTAPKYYDAAEFYNRLWTRLCRPDLAQEFLKVFVSNLKDDKNIFFNQFLAILAVRSVGNYFETMQLDEGQEKRIEFLTSFANNVADKEFLN